MRGRPGRRGVDELVIARGEGRWARNPQLVWFKETIGNGRWREHTLGRIATADVDGPHDIEPLSFTRGTGETLRGVAVLVSSRQLLWYEMPPDPTQPWKRHDVGSFPGAASHSGMAIGDIAGHARPDIVCGMFWAECPADPTQHSWVIRRFGDWDANGWGGMAKLALGDFDGDGKADIVASEAEIPDARLAVFTRDPNQPDGLWSCRQLDHELYCPHSLVLADVNDDGRLDILVGQMTVGGWSFPLNPRPRILAYANKGGFDFDRRVLVQGWAVHEMGLAPPRRHGQWLIYAADEIQPQKFPEMNTHVSYWLLRPTR